MHVGQDWVKLKEELSRGLEELLAQLQLQASKVSHWVSDDSRELPQSKTALDFSVKT